MGTLERAVANLALATTAALAALAGSFALSGWSESFVIVPVDQFVIDETPGEIVTWAILTLGETGHVLHVAVATGLVVTVLTVIGLAGREFGWRVKDPFAGAVLATLPTGLFVYFLTGSIVSTVATALPFGIVLSIPAMYINPSQTLDSRREVLGLAGGLFTFGVFSYLLREYIGEPHQTEPLPDQNAHDELLSTAADRNLPVDGLGDLVTDVDDFYSVDIASTRPSPDPDRWSLQVTGSVEQPRTITYDDLINRSSIKQFVTLRCIGEPLNGTLIDTALWTGVPIAPLLADASPEPTDDCGCVMVHAADRYYERFPLETLERSLLVYGMNGHTLPVSNGAPVRLLVPGHWGKINIKWISEIEVLEEDAEGYWEERGWHGSGPVETVAKLSVVNRLDDDRIQVAGHAYAGTRGIDRVEVSVDDGESWNDAQLSDPLPSATGRRAGEWDDGSGSGGENESNRNDSDIEPDVWRQWEYTFEPIDGTAQESDTEVVVRAVDGTGTVQAETESDAFPSGPTGWVRRQL